jgi:hypothetical protein
MALGQDAQFLFKKLGLLAALAVLFAPQAYASSCPVGGPASNCPPPAGSVILDLDGTPIPHSYTPYTVSFTAAAASTNLSFAFREDPAFLLLDNVA